MTDSRNDNLITVNPYGLSFIDLETLLNEADKVRIAYTVLEMFADYGTYDVYVGAINPKYADAFIAEFERANDCQVWFNTNTYML